MSSICRCLDRPGQMQALYSTQVDISQPWWLRQLSASHCTNYLSLSFSYLHTCAQTYNHLQNGFYTSRYIFAFLTIKSVLQLASPDREGTCPPHQNITLTSKKNHWRRDVIQHAAAHAQKPFFWGLLKSSVKPDIFPIWHAFLFSPVQTPTSHLYHRMSFSESHTGCGRASHFSGHFLTVTYRLHIPDMNTGSSHSTTTGFFPKKFIY